MSALITGCTICLKPIGAVIRITDQLEVGIMDQEFLKLVFKCSIFGSYGNTCSRKLIVWRYTKTRTVGKNYDYHGERLIDAIENICPCPKDKSTLIFYRGK